MACTVIDGRPVAVTGSWDGTVRVWDLTTGTSIANLCCPAAVTALGIGHDSEIVVGVSSDVLVLARPG